MTSRSTLASLFFIALASLTACKKDPPAPENTASSASSAATPASASARPFAFTPDQVGSGSAVQVAIGGRGTGGVLPFEITSVHEKVERTDAPPFYKGTGAWTVFDAKAEGDVTFTISLKETRRLKSEPPMILFDAVIATKTADDGGKLVTALVKALATKDPPPHREDKPTVPLRANSVVLAEDANRNDDGSLSGKGGGWTASKWTFEAKEEGNGELYVNYSLSAKKGELKRKSASYDPTVVLFFAAALRDGKPLLH